MRTIAFLLTALPGLALASGENGHNPNTLAQNDPRRAYVRPLEIPFPDDAPYTPLVATLGKMLFFDPRLSGAQNISCATCHNPSFGWEVTTPGPIGAQNTMLARQAPTVLNTAYMPHFFWDGRAATLEEQAAGPIKASGEMNADIAEVAELLDEIGTYRDGFAQAFPGEGLTPATILTAIATYERTIVSAWAPFDHWVDGDEDAISDAAKRGFALFDGKAGCSGCHQGWNFTDNAFHDIGIALEDIGRQAVEDEGPHSQFAFKTPGLRNTKQRAPYMHDGSLTTLAEVVAHYAAGGIERPSRSPKMAPLSLSDDETRDLVAFLESLTADEVPVPTPMLPVN